MKPRTYRVKTGDSARVICRELGRDYSAPAWREVLTANGLAGPGRTLEERIAFFCLGSMPVPGAELVAPSSWECVAKDDGAHGEPRCFWRLRSPGPLGPCGLPASGPLCAACSAAVERVLERPRQRRA